MNKSDDKEIDVFQNKCIRKILEVRWQDHVSTEELLERAEMEPLSRDVKRRRWKLKGHILRKDKSSDDVTALTWAPKGKRKRGRPKTTWRRMIEKEREEGGWKSWEEVRKDAVSREKWRHITVALCTTRCEVDK